MSTSWTNDVDANAKAAGFVPPRVAWGLCLLMFVSTVLNYMDRQAIALVGPQVREEFGINFETFGWVMAAFSLSYALAQVPAGFLADRLAVRGVYAGAVTWWSLAAVASAFAPGLAALLVLRGLLGLGESFNWPCALKVTSRVLPPSDRSLGNGLFNSGAAVGAVLTPLLVPFLAVRYGWRTSFIVVGSAGFAWVVAWLIMTSRLSILKQVMHAPREFTESDIAARGSMLPAVLAFTGLFVVSVSVGVVGTLEYGLPGVWLGVACLMIGLLLVAWVLPTDSLSGNGWTADLGEVVRLRRFWVLVVVSVSVNICWHFLVGWMPSYLKEDRGMTYLASGYWSAVPFLAADVGNLAGGALALVLARGGLPPARARLGVMALCALFISAGAGVGFAPNDLATIGLLASMALGAAAFMANYFAFCQEVSPRHTGLVVGILGGLGNLFAAGVLPMAGWVKDQTGGFSPIFVVVGFAPFVGVAALALGWGRDELKPAGSSFDELA